jgi:hypothetical protein
VFDTSLAPPGYYNGTGNPNTNFTVSTESGVELGLGVQYRKTGPQVVPDANSSVYHVNTGIYTTPADFCTGICALWNYEYSVNLQVGGANPELNLSDVTISLDVLNVANGQHLAVPIGLLDNATYGPSGENAPFAGNASVDYGLQNSQNLAFSYVPIFSPSFNFDPLADNTYVFTLSVVLNSDSSSLGSVSATVIAGDGAAVPLPAALPLFATGLGGLGWLARRRRKRSSIG